MVEYALIMVLIAVACIAILAVFGQHLITLWQGVIDQMRNPGHIM